MSNPSIAQPVNSHSLHNAPPMPADDAPMLQWALWYAALGWHVMPLHKPLFNEAGECIGCTCEEYKRSEANRLRLRALGREREYDPHYVCPTPGKHPKHRAWEQKASNDPAELRKMGRLWRDANIGQAPGRDNMLVLDADLYKDTFGGADLAGGDTLTTLTQGGGTHERYTMRPDDAYGQSVGDLPPGLDIRAHGGMAVLPPSIGPSGNRYQWEDGYGPLDVAPLPLPDAIRTMLDSAAGNRPHKDAGPPDDAAVAASVALVDAVLAHGDMVHGGWQVWDGTGRRAILDVCPFMPANDKHGEDGAAGVFIRADGSIGATCHHNRCKHEIHEHGDNGWAWLRELAGMPKQDAAADLAQLHEHILRGRLFLHSAAGAALLKEHEIPIKSGVSVIDAYFEIAAQWNSLTVRPGIRRLALAAGVAVATATGVLSKLVQARLFHFEKSDERFSAAALTCDQSWYCCSEEGNYCTSFDRTGVAGLNFYAEHRVDDVFRDGHAQYTKRNPDGLPPVGRAALHIASRLAAGAADVADLAEAVGMSIPTVNRALGKLHGYGLAMEEAGVWDLTESMLLELGILRRNVRSYGVHAMRRLEHAQHRLRMAAQAAGVDPERHKEQDDDDPKLARAFAELRAERRRLLQAAHASPMGGWLLRRKWLRWDEAEMARDLAAVVAAVRPLKRDGLPAAEIRRMLAYADYAAADVSRALAYA